MSTEEKILQHFQQGKTLTKLEALYEPFRTLNLGDKIFRLRLEGYPIEKRWKETPEGKRYAEYFLPKETEN